jgi:hypothetical protein
MCGRYAITLPPEAMRQLFQTCGELPNWPAYFRSYAKGKNTVRLC